MPELPEVETVRRGLQASIVGRRIETVEVHHPRAVRRISADAFNAAVSGATVAAIDRRGKYLVVSLDRDVAIMIHLRMSGQVLIEHPDMARPRHCHVVLTLSSVEGDRELRFVDPRTFGEVAAFDPRCPATVVPELASLGPDPLVEGWPLADFRLALARSRRPVKSVLIDQRVVAGIGNIYADEILHRAGVNPLRPAAAVKRGQLRRLHAAVGEVLEEAIACGGSTLGDAQYVGVDGRPGDFQHRHRVYGRSGLQCLSCGRSRVVSARLAGRTTSWCRVCQR